MRAFASPLVRLVDRRGLRRVFRGLVSVSATGMLVDAPEYKAQAAVAEARYKVFELWSQKAELTQARASAKDVGAVDRRIADAQARVEKLDGAPMLPAGATTSRPAAVTGPEKFPTPSADRTLKPSTSVYWAPSTTKLKNLVSGAIGVLGHGVAYGTREVKRGPHYNGHPTKRTTDHFIAGYGYTGQGANLKYADPAINVWAGADVKKTNSMSATKMRDFIAPWGLVA